MTATQLNAEMLHNLSIIAEDEALMKRVARYLRKIAAEREDSSMLTHEEFIARINKARQQTGKQFANVEELDQYIRSL